MQYFCCAGRTAVSLAVLVVDGSHASPSSDGAELAAKGRPLGWLPARL